MRNYRGSQSHRSFGFRPVITTAGAAYENSEVKEALAAYEKYLALAPNGSLAPAIRSIIDQLRRDAAGQEIIP